MSDSAISRGRGRYLLVYLLVLALVSCQAVSGAAPPAEPATKPAQPRAAPSATPAAPAPAPVPASSPAQLSAPAVNPVTQAAVQAGVLTCASRINEVMSFLTVGSKSNAYLFVPQRQPDLGIFSVSLSTQTLDGVVRYSSASFAPTGSSQAAVYDTVEYMAQTPDAVEKSAFKNLKRKGTLGKDTVMLDGGSVTIFLMPAGPGCIVIKKEVVQ